MHLDLVNRHEMVGEVDISNREQPWKTGQPYSVGCTVGYNKHVYTCRKDHTAKASLAPEYAPELWHRCKVDPLADNFDYYEFEDGLRYGRYFCWSLAALRAGAGACGSARRNGLT